MEDKLTLDQIQTAIDGIVEKYSAEFYHFEMKQRRWKKETLRWKRSWEKET